MSSPGSVTEWIGQLQKGERAVVEKLWDRYFHRLVQFARKKLQALPRRSADEEDVALDAFDSFCRGAEQGRFSCLEGRDNLWALLVTITARKAFQLQLREGRRKRGGNAVLDEAALGWAPAGMREMEQVLDREPTPEFAAEVADECGRLLASLTRPVLRSVAQWKMEGFTNEEIADRLGCAIRSVERKLCTIRSIWSQSEPVT
jgi:DNA-directed RNA polymerase specialized sigma24 family protein